MTRLALALILLATPAAALTCAPADALRAFREAAAGPEPWMVLHGRVEFDPARMPEAGFQGLPGEGGLALGAPDRPMDPVPAAFRGEVLGPSGWAPTALTALTLRPTCAGAWCGSMAPGRDWLLFARLVDEAPVVEVGPCGGAAFEAPAPELLSRLAACMGGACEDAP